MTAFEIVKDAVDIVDAAERYGIQVNRHKKALCPFHDDNEPSLSFKEGRFTCFSCGAHGDVIDLVAHQIGAGRPMDAVRELNQSYGLHIDIDAPVPSLEILRLRRIREEKKAFSRWEADAYVTLSAYFRKLCEWREAYAPRYPDEALHPRFAEALTRQGYIEYILDTVFIRGGTAEKVDFYNSSRGMVEQTSRWMRRESEFYAGGIGAYDNPSGIVFPFERPYDGYAHKVA